MGQSMSLQMGRTMAIAPALQKSLRLLQMNALEFEQEVRSALAENPMLEEIDDGSGSAGDSNGSDGPLAGAEGSAPDPSDVLATALSNSDSDFSSESATGDEGHVDGALWDSGLWSTTSSRGSQDGSDSEFSAVDAAACEQSLRDHLLTQLGSLPLPELERDLAIVVIDSLDPSGYLNASLDDLVELARELLASDSGDRALLDEDALLIALARVQSLEPAGVAARTASECLLLQLRDKPAATTGLTVARQIARDHLPLLAQNDFRLLGDAVGADEATLGEALRLIRSLDPKPGLAFGGELAAYAVPEVVVRKVGNRWVARLHPGATPRVRLHSTYAEIVGRDQAGSAGGLGQQLQEAQWLLRSIAQRADTIEATAAAIVRRQQSFFEHGDIGLKPMKLADIAEDIGVHESTVSRVVNSKYLQCPRGLVPLRRFFTSQVETSAGVGCSATAVKAMIRLLIDAEPAADPHSDHRLTRLLTQRGIRISRRTVTKYRDALGIDAADRRRQLAASPNEGGEGETRPTARPRTLRRVTRYRDSATGTAVAASA